VLEIRKKKEEIASASPWSSIRFKSLPTVWACASGCIWSHLCAIRYAVQGDPVRFKINTLLNASNMKSLIELETEIKHLPESEIRQLTKRLQDYLDEKWDRQMETDLTSDRLDRLIAKAEADIAANHVKDLDEVLHNP
jgi:hypothetical protein